MERRNHQRRLPLLYVVLAVVLILAVVLEGCDPSLLWLVWIVAWIVYGTWFDQWVKLDRLHTYSPYETIPIRGMCRSLHDDWEVWVKVEDSEGSTVGGPWSQILHYGYNTFGWDWTAGGDEGYYTAIARLLPPGDPIGRWCATEQLVVQAGVVEYPYRLEVWCGDQTKGNPGEDLHLPFAHPIAVEVVDAGIQVPVTFRTQLGTLQSGTLVEDPPGSGNWYSQVTQESFPCLVAGNRTAQIAWASLTLSTEQQPETGDCLPHVVTASCEQARDDAYITVYSIVDGETSHLGDRTHQKGRQGQDLVEVPGDNYRVKRNQNNEQVPDPGQPGDYKDVIVELDYYLWEGATQEKIGTIAGYIEEVLETATVQADVRVGNEIPAGTGEGQMPPETDREKRMELLAYHRDHNELWESWIHVILGSRCHGSSRTLGIVEHYSGAWSGWEPLHRGSGPREFSSPYLDSVGCFVFADTVWDYEDRAIFPECAIALVAAHEIGHALGMWHYQAPHYPPNVMVENIHTALTIPTGFGAYGHFAPASLDGSNDVDDETWDGMNTRHVLGIDCVYIKEE